jgi:pilus assembly protein CpaC
MISFTGTKIVLAVLLLTSMALLAQAPALANAPSAPVASEKAQTAPAEGETVHVLVGKSIVINVQRPLTRVLSSNSDVVETMAISPTQVVVEGKAPGGSSLILWSNDGESQVLDVVADIDIAGLRGAIQKTYPKENLHIEADGPRLLLTGTASNAHIAEDLGKMALVYSKEVVNSILVPISHDRQVLLEVKFAEVDRTVLSQLAVNMFSTGAGNNIGTTTTGQFGGFSPVKINDAFGGGEPHFPFEIKDFTINQVLNIFLFRPDLHLGTVVQALQAHNALQILAEPNLMAISGQKATFLAGGEFPYPVVQPSAGFSSVTILFKPFGVKLDFTSAVQEDNTLRLHVAPEVSALDFTNAVTLSGGGTVPAISTRRAETEIELKDGQSFGIAGLLDRRATVQLSKVPGIGDIPVLGQLFRSKSINKTNTELMVFVTPHIIDPVHAAPAAAPAVPKMPVPVLDEQKFDKELPGHKQTGSTPEGAGTK